MGNILTIDEFLILTESTFVIIFCNSVRKWGKKMVIHHRKTKQSKTIILITLYLENNIEI